MDRFFLSPGHTETLEQRVADLTVSRAETVDHSAAELRRIERDLHDGAQARLVALGMTLGMADQMFADDPEAARKLVSEARDTTGAALGDLRAVVRGIHPPVLADRGLAGAVAGAGARHGRPGPGDRPTWTAARRRRSSRRRTSRSPSAWPTSASTRGAGNAWVELSPRRRGAARPGGRRRPRRRRPRRGHRLRGVMRRLAAFDGTMTVSSPRGGPTLVTLEVPCALSSPKTTPSSGTA